MTTPTQSIDRPDELHIARLRTRVAVDLAPLISSVIEEHEGRLLIVADVVDCWLRLPNEIRAAYEKVPAYAGLSRFVGDYVDGIDCAWVKRQAADPDHIVFADAEQLCFLDWRRHEAEVRRRHEAGEPPTDEWLLLITADQRSERDGER